MTLNTLIERMRKKYGISKDDAGGWLSGLCLDVAQATVEAVRMERTNPVYADFDKKPTTDERNQVYRLTCVAFLLEGVCACAVKNAAIQEAEKKEREYFA